MGVTVSHLDQLAKAVSDLRSGGKVLGKAADRVGDVQGVFVDQIEKPLCSGKWWSGVGQSEAKVVVGVNTTAMATSNIRLGEASAAAYALATLLERAADWWREMYHLLHNGNYHWTEDGTVTGKDTVNADCTVWTADALTKKLKKILSYVDQADEEFTKAMRRIVHHDLPVTTTKATPGVSDRAYDAYQGAVDDLSGHGPLAALLSRADKALDPKQAEDWTLEGNYHKDGGDGYVIGPDGKRYEIVVPQYDGADGKRYTHGSGPQDVGWYTVGTGDGSGYLDPKASPGELVAWGIVGGIGQDAQRHNAPDTGKTASLRVGPDGYPESTDGSDSGGQPPDDKKGPPHYGFVRREDGTLEWSDDVDNEPRNRAEQRDWDRTNGNRSGLSPDEQRDLDRFESRREDADRTGGAIDVVNGAGDAVSHANDTRYYHYHVEFQQGADGSRRAVVTTYQVVHQDGTDKDVVVTNVAYVGSDGHLHYRPATWQSSSEESTRGATDFEVAPGSSR